MEGPFKRRVGSRGSCLAWNKIFIYFHRNRFGIGKPVSISSGVKYFTFMQPCLGLVESVAQRSAAGRGGKERAFQQFRICT